MKIKNRVSRLINQYQTRQQLRNLPEHLFKDIGQSNQKIKQECDKNGFITLLLQSLRYLIKGT